MAPLLEAMADAALPEPDHERLLVIVEHLAENRMLARELLCRPGTSQIARRVAYTLGDLLEPLLAQHHKATLLPKRLIALQLAEAQLGLIRAWLNGAASCSGSRIVQSIVESSQGLLAGLSHAAQQEPRANKS